MNTLNERGTTAAIPENKLDAFTFALKLAITATNNKRTKMAVQLAKELSFGLSEFEIALCKKRALKELEMQT